MTICAHLGRTSPDPAYWGSKMGQCWRAVPAFLALRGASRQLILQANTDEILVSFSYLKLINSNPYLKFSLESNIQGIYKKSNPNKSHFYIIKLLNISLLVFKNESNTRLIINNFQIPIFFEQIHVGSNMIGTLVSKPNVTKMSHTL